MRINTSCKIGYKLPSSLSEFQKGMYVHLINWKWKNITKEAGVYRKKINGIVQEYEYDAILPVSVQNKYPLIYSPILSELLALKAHFSFKFHQHFNHMVSSQAANINLFLPILLHPKGNEVIQSLKINNIIKLVKIAKEKLYKGFRVEYWDGNTEDNKGLLGDHSAKSGTDSDIAIAFYNTSNELCLWLIEHKLTEKEFTTCGGCKSKSRDKQRHLCEKPFSEIIKNKSLCFYHDVKGYNYWDITEKNQLFYINNIEFPSCPFQGGMNQLWRNQMLGLALENVGLYKHVYFSVVHHIGNKELEASINNYKRLINNNPKFTVFTSTEMIEAARTINDKDLNDWVSWYKDLYKV